MRIAVCDDDGQALAGLLELLTKYQSSRGVSFECHPFDNGTDFLCDMKGGEYDLVFMDVLMAGVSGVQVAREMRELDKNVKLVFISMSPDFAVESYRVGAYHYLLKPIEAGSLFLLLDKVRSELAVGEEQGFVLKRREGVVRLSFATIEYVEVVNKKVSFHLSDGVVHEVTAALTDLEERLLLRPEFIKPHRSYVINLNYVQSIGTNGIMTRNGHHIPVSRQQRSQVQDTYLHFLRSLESGDLLREKSSEAVSEKLERPDGPWRILLVDDEPVEAAFWANVLRSHGCVVDVAENGRKALKLAENGAYDCVLLDVMIPDEDGFSICERMGRLVRTPVIFLSCLTESDKQMKGFAVGGIDYITKDTSTDLFWVKVETRIKMAVSDHTQFCYGPLLLDLGRRKVLIDQQELNLTPIEFDILWRLSEHTDHTFTPREIFDMVWGGQPWDGGQMVQIHMSRLRRKLEKAWENHHFIETVWGEGYRFVPITY